jgi:ketosteroid isomerase-like protein
MWDIEQLDLARARFKSLASEAPSDPRALLAQPNAASAVMELWVAAVDACVTSGDWETMRAWYSPNTVFADRQRRSQVTGGLEMQIGSLRERGAAGSRPERVLLGTAGDRIEILRALWSGGPPNGRFEIEHLALVEVDATGLFTATILFDPDDTRAAQREAWTRWAVTDPVAAPFIELLSELTDAWNGRDRARIRARFAENAIIEDHRHAGLGRIEGADAYVESNVVLWELAPDQRIEFGGSWPAVDRHAALVPLRREGTLADGGVFESEYLWLCCATDGRITRLELFEPADLNAALERFEEFRTE